jgi:hypothetical protein
LEEIEEDSDSEDEDDEDDEDKVSVDEDGHDIVPESKEWFTGM